MRRGHFHCQIVFFVFFGSTYQFSCRGVSKDELNAYEAENVLERVVDKEFDEETHVPIERCKGVAITGKFKTIQESA